MIFYKMTGLEHPNRVAEADEDEDIEARVFTLPDARQLVASGDAPDMKTALGLALI